MFPFFKRKTIDLPPPPPSGTYDFGSPDFPEPPKPEPEEMEMTEMPPFPPLEAEPFGEDTSISPSEEPWIDDVEEGHDMPEADSENVENTPEQHVERVIREPTKPIFVSVADYQAILEKADDISHRLTACQQAIDSAVSTATAADTSFARYQRILEEIEKKLSSVDRLISKNM